MLIIIFLLLIILGVSIPNRSTLNRVFKLIFLVWTAVLCLSVLNYSKLYTVSLQVYIYFIAAMFSYFIGFFIVKYSNTGTEGYLEKVLIDTTNISKKKYFHLLSIFTIILCFYYAIRFFNIYNSILDIGDIRSARFEIGGLFVNGYSLIIYNYIVTPLVLFYRLMLVFSLVFGIKKYPYFFIYGVIIFLLYYFIGAGRIVLVETLFSFMILNVFENRKYNIKDYIRNVLLLLLFALLFIAGTYLRLSRDEISLSLIINIADTSFQQVLTYVTGGFRAFDYALDNYNHLLYGFGIYTFASFEELIFNFLSLVGFTVEPYSYYWGSIISKPIIIGNGVEFNALYTGLFPFYFDLGILGVILYPMLLGLLSRKSIDLLMKYKKLSAFFLVVCLLQISIFIFMTFRFNSGILLAMIVSFLIIMKNRKVTNSNG